MRRITPAAAVAVSTLAVVGVIGCFGGVAGAQAPEAQGWWTVTNPGVVATPAPPDVPGDGLVVEGGRDAASPTAFAALVYDLPSGATASSLTVEVAPNALTTPNSTLQLCTLDKPDLQPEQGGAMSNAPAYTCDGKVTAPSDGGTYRFSISSLVAGGVLAVAILPTASTDRVVLAKPGRTSLDASMPASGAGDFEPSLGAGSPAGEAAEPATFTPIAPLSGTGGPAAVAPEPAVHGGVIRGPRSAGRFVPDLVGRGAEAATASTVVLVILGALLGAAVWMLAGNAAVRSAVTAMNGPSENSTVQGLGG
jgi:hypothetical protein